MCELVFCYVPCPDEATARQLGQQMVAAQLAACANTFPIGSQYMWAGALQSDQEWVLLLKTTSALAATLEQALLAAHPYELPCLAQWMVQVNEAYAQWVQQQVKV
jgi:periplasmic divalent cation tolerance protein